MHETLYTDQSASALRLSLVEGELDLDQFQILSTGEAQFGSLHVKAGIIGASHFLAFRIGDRVIYEVFACTEVETQNRRAFCGPLGSISGNLDIIFPGFKGYSFGSELDTWDDGSDLLNLMDSKIKSNSDRGDIIALSFDFPKSGEDQKTPKTLVLVDVDGDVDVKAVTAHAYPNEDRIVFTETTLRRI